jgi:Zn-dependent protease with chaperone function
VSLGARYFDGRTSRLRDVRLEATQDGLLLVGEGVERRIERADLEVSEPEAGGVRQLRFRGGGGCEIDEGPELAALLALMGHREGGVVRWQSSWLLVALAAALLVILAAWVYRAGLPWIAERVAKGLPDGVHAQLGDQTLALLDRTGFQPSELASDRQSELVDRFRALRTPDGVLPSYAIHFRGGGPFGANAFALLNGDMVVTDELVALAEDDLEILAVLGHELGHLRERHGLRLFLQGSAVGFAVAAWFGDISSALVGLPAFLLQAKYSRDFEREADAYAAALLRANDIPVAHLARILERLTDATRPDWSYLTSHPLTEERVAALEEL